MSFDGKLLVCALLTLSATAQAQRVRLDDSLSPVDVFAVDLEWSQSEMRRVLAAMLGGTDDDVMLTGHVTNVDVRLDTRDYVGQSARIFLNLPALINGLGNSAGFELSWNVSNPFFSGSVRPGQSTLVFDGRIEQPVTAAVFSFALLLESGADAPVFDVEPYYEIELSP